MSINKPLNTMTPEELDAECARWDQSDRPPMTDLDATCADILAVMEAESNYGGEMVFCTADTLRALIEDRNRLKAEVERLREAVNDAQLSLDPNYETRWAKHYKAEIEAARAALEPST